MPSRKVYVPSATAEAESEGWRVALMPSTNDGLDGLTLVLRGALRVHAGGDASGPGTWPDARGFAILRVSDGAIVSADTPQGERPPVDGLALLIERSRPRSVVGPSLTNYTGGACRPVELRVTVGQRQIEPAPASRARVRPHSALPSATYAAGVGRGTRSPAHTSSCPSWRRLMPSSASHSTAYTSFPASPP